LKKFNDYLRRYNSGVLKREVLNMLWKLKEIGNAARHDTLVPEVARQAELLAKQAIAEIL
ncbi:MAG TPA: hypothetical protein VFE08_15245, partial [Candidatus Sulfotelmatobacter sp.]|nr:hypothetical protein [Candidatus Sulfotelmatobacter sp.]